jgi:predicted sugar kinase
MYIEIGAPASLPLALVKVESDNGPQSCLLGITLQHPPAELMAQKFSKLRITGARAHIGHEAAKRFWQYHKLKRRAQVEIEQSIPAFTGLGADVSLGLSMACALSWLNDFPLDNTLELAQSIGLEAQDALHLWSFDRGGLLLVNPEAESGVIPPPLARLEIAHEPDEAWAFVFVMPRVPYNTPDSYETERLATLLQAASALSSESDLVRQELWRAVEGDDIAAFGQALMKLQEINNKAALKEALPPLNADNEAILQMMRDNGAYAWGQSLTGYSLYALVKGSKATIELRKILREHVGYFGGLVIATITDNKGAQHVVKNVDLNEGKLSDY